MPHGKVSSRVSCTHLTHRDTPMPTLVPSRSNNVIYRISTNQRLSAEHANQRSQHIASSVMHAKGRVPAHADTVHDPQLIDLIDNPLVQQHAVVPHRHLVRRP
jgi:hypothetical protein